MVNVGILEKRKKKIVRNYESLVFNYNIFVVFKFSVYILCMNVC